MYQYFVCAIYREFREMQLVNYVYTVDYKIYCIDDINDMKSIMAIHLNCNKDELVIISYQILCDKLDA